MMHKAWNTIEEVPYCFSRSSVKFQGHAAPKIVEFDPDWAFPDCNSSLNSPMAMKCYTKLETAKERCPIVFQGHSSNFKVTQDKTSPILTQIGRFRTIGRSQLSNPSDLPCFNTIWFPCLFTTWAEKKTILSISESPMQVWVLKHIGLCFVQNTSPAKWRWFQICHPHREVWRSAGYETAAHILPTDGFWNVV